MSARPSPPSSSPIPGIKIPDLPAPDLGPLLRHSRGANASVGEALKGAYIAGAADGFSIGQTVGYAAGTALGTVKGVVIACAIQTSLTGLLAYVVYLFTRASRP
jgi:hypothetical protein